MAIQTALTQAQQLYVAYYGRPADEAGLQFWADKIDQNGVDAVVNDFGTSTEFEARFGDLSSEELVQNLYQQAFGRPADAEGLEFYTERLDDGRLTLAEIANTIAGGAQNDDITVLENKVAAADLYTEAAGEAHSGTAADKYATDFLADVDAETDVDALDIDAVVADIPAGAPSDLTEALTNLADAEAGVTAALAAAAETANAASENPKEGDELEDEIKTFSEEDLNAAIKTAQGEIDSAEAKINNETSELLGSRGTEFSDAGNANLGDDASEDATAVVNGLDDTTFDDGFDSKGESVKDQAFDLGIESGDRLTDANIAKAVSEAQKAVNADKAQYVIGKNGDASLADSTTVKDADTDTFTAKALQIKANNAEAALNADVSANGSNAELLKDLRTAITDFASNGGDLNTDTGSAGEYSDLNALLGGINDTLKGKEGAESVDKLVAKFEEGEYDLSDNEDAAGIQSAIEAVEQRNELTEASDKADTAFHTTETGGVLEAAEELQSERDEQIEKVSDAEDAQADAQSDLAELNSAKDDYDAAVKTQEDAEQYFEDNDLQLPVSLEDSVIATEDNDIFLFSGEEATVAGFGAEGDDQLFIGTDFTWSAVEASVDVAGDRVGDADVQEVFAQQVGNNTVLSFEDEAFAGNAQNGSDLTEVTLTGVSANDLSLSDDGFITVA
ncbi:DUF4214 domain-containing protein [Halomonas piscis]|uniref:DUF4214 domain-containing protein n=1 Tax=Halomonas piscis TaxID=3031727 RepID=UPI0028997825|nr:DUF4214 domain-containing protein [Halomonas piscis]